MMRIYARYMDRWERKLATRDTNRVVRPFEWGTDWLNSLEFPSCPSDANGNSAECVSRFVTEARDNSDRFFSYEPVRDYRLEGNRLTFTSPVQTRYPENNTAHALWFPAPNDDGRVVIVLPQWNSGPDGHVGLARLLNRCGISAPRMTMFQAMWGARFTRAGNRQWMCAPAWTGWRQGDTAGWESWARAWGRAWPSSRRRMTPESGWGSSIMSRCTLQTRCGRGSPRKT